MRRKAIEDRLADILLVHVYGEIAIVREPKGVPRIRIVEQSDTSRGTNRRLRRPDSHTFSLLKQQGGSFPDSFERIYKTQNGSISLDDAQGVAARDFFERNERGLGVPEPFC